VSRELLLLGLTALVGGGGAWLVAPLCNLPRSRTSEPAWQRERRAWRRLISPLVVVVAGTAMLLGWALQEPEVSDERLAWCAWIAVVVVLALWLRAIARLVRAVRARPAVPIAVVGLARPGVVVDPRLRQMLDDEAFAAALAHEAAHARHRDPLRIALAQLATDLQWPWPQPRRTLGNWRDLLEQTRDDEAVMNGVRPEDLAAAIVGAAQWRVRGAGVGLTGGERIEQRILRLLDGVPPGRPPRSCTFAILVVSSLVAALIVGFTVGDELVARLPGVLR
jgi:hypothetical protein